MNGIRRMGLALTLVVGVLGCSNADAAGADEDEVDGSEAAISGSPADALEAADKTLEKRRAELWNVRAVYGASSADTLLPVTAPQKMIDTVTFLTSADPRQWMKTFSWSPRDARVKATYVLGDWTWNDGEKRLFVAYANGEVMGVCTISRGDKKLRSCYAVIGLEVVGDALADPPQ